MDERENSQFLMRKISKIERKKYFFNWFIKENGLYFAMYRVILISLNWSNYF